MSALSRGMADEGPGPDGKQMRGNRQSRQQMLEKYDSDGDGKLSESERAALPEGLRQKPGNRQDRQQMLEKYDSDGDGKLSESERAALPEGLRQKMKNRKGESRNENKPAQIN